MKKKVLCFGCMRTKPDEIYLVRCKIRQAGTFVYRKMGLTISIVQTRSEK